jgi:hypothetical protein
LNFGSQQRVDVTLTYKIFDSGNQEVFSQTDTVAVETTASFVKQIQLPYDFAPGQYSLVSNLLYQGQMAPATSRFAFTVERKFFGLFLGDLLWLCGIIAFIFVGNAALIWILRAPIQRRGFAMHDYSDKPREERIYYEIVSDTIAQMRQRAGDRALDVALRTEGLMIDGKTGRVLRLTENPAKVVAGLVSGYEKAFGKKVSFSLRENKKI